jgi:hypothetical protein
MPVGLRFGPFPEATYGWSEYRLNCTKVVHPGASVAHPQHAHIRDAPVSIQLYQDRLLAA